MASSSSSSALRVAHQAKLSNAMDPTTLITFIFRAPPEVRIVELLGSWDNFNQPYQMHHDRRRGQGFWSGCFKFDNIIFDGQGMLESKPRNGGLKQGGTYWYYYRVNYDFDAFDDRQPNTTRCPALPGQRVNVMDVPYELLTLPQRSQSVYGGIVGSLTHLADQKQTMEPQDKFAVLAPLPISKLHSRCLTDEALDGRLEGQQYPSVAVELPVSPVSTPHPQQMPPRQCVDSKMDFYYTTRDNVSRPGSLYSQKNARSSLSIQSQDHVGDREMRDVTALPTFPYPSCLGPAPLGSLEALGAALFVTSEHAEFPVSRRSSRAPPQTYTPSSKRSNISIGRRSVHDATLRSSRLETNQLHDAALYHSQIYSIPNVEIGECLDEDVSSVPDTSSSSYSPRRSEDMDENPTPSNEVCNFDEFLAAAADIGSEGQNNPLALQAAPYATHNINPQGIANRMEARSSSRSSSSSNGRAGNHGPRTHQSRRYDTRETRLSPRPFVNYSLPTIASDSSHSLTKTASIATERSRMPQDDALPLPSVLVEGQGRSMAEDIFHELGF